MGVGVLRHHYLQFNYGSLHAVMNTARKNNVSKYLEDIIKQKKQQQQNI